MTQNKMLLRVIRLRLLIADLCCPLIQNVITMRRIRTPSKWNWKTRVWTVGTQSWADKGQSSCQVRVDKGIGDGRDASSQKKTEQQWFGSGTGLGIVRASRKLGCVKTSVRIFTNKLTSCIVSCCEEKHKRQQNGGTIDLLPVQYLLLHP